MKNEINEQWSGWVSRQLDRNVNKESIRKTLQAQNYSPEVIDRALSFRQFTDLRVFVKDSFVTDEECEHIIAVAQDVGLNKAVVSGSTKGETSEGRTGTNCWIPHDKTDTMKAVATRIADLVNMPLHYAESIQVVHYDAEQEYRPHMDGWKHDGSVKSKRMMDKRGQRLCTCLVYLNSPEEGGETVFPKLKKAVKPVKGSLLYFSNVEQNTNVLHPDSLHGGAPVKKGEKWAFNLWFRERQ
jgi:prolyl 4-hydroxylase